MTRPVGRTGAFDERLRYCVSSRKGPDFASVLREKSGGVSFSAHARSRLAGRRIEMNDADMAKLNDAVIRAESRGSRDSLIVLADKAFIVNIPNRTVITAMDGESIRENVFTNIDSTVIAG